MAYGANPLYAYHPVLNAEEICAWAMESGFKSCLFPSDMHVTTAFSRRPFSIGLSAQVEKLRKDWSNLVATEGGRQVVQLGDKGAVVLEFQNMELQQEWEGYQSMGASWDFPSYRPHVTLTYRGAPENLADIEPYRGPIVLGTTRFRDLQEDAPDYDDLAPDLEARGWRKAGSQGAYLNPDYDFGGQLQRLAAQYAGTALGAVYAEAAGRSG